MNKDALPDNVDELKNLFITTISDHENVIKKIQEEKIHWQEKYESHSSPFA